MTGAPGTTQETLTILLESAGADRGALLARCDGGLLLAAAGTASGGARVVEPAPSPEQEALPWTVLRHVAQTGEAVVLDDPSKSGPFQGDPHVAGRRPRSILCMPIAHRSCNEGVVYLESDAPTFVFTSERVAVLSALCAQAAVALASARLHDDLRRRIERSAADLRARDDELASASVALQKTRKQLEVQERLASLGQLAAGVAHEIRNPLNFITNFSELSLELLEELTADLQGASSRLPPPVFARLEDTVSTLGDNLRKVAEHGQRANRIVRGMLMHAQASSDEPEPANLHEILSQSARLAHHGLRARHADFMVEITEDFDPSIGLVDLLPSDMGRVFLNIISNACYAIRQKMRASGRDYKGQISLRTRPVGDSVEIRIRDNGPGFGDDVADKLFRPFFTTKPTSEGTGLGLSISHEIVTQKHHGELRAESEPGKFAEFVITIPRRAPKPAKNRPA